MFPNHRIDGLVLRSCSWPSRRFLWRPCYQPEGWSWKIICQLLFSWTSSWILDIDLSYGQWYSCMVKRRIDRRLVSKVSESWSFSILCLIIQSRVVPDGLSLGTWNESLRLRVNSLSNITSKWLFLYHMTLHQAAVNDWTIRLITVSMLGLFVTQPLVKKDSY